MTWTLSLRGVSAVCERQAVSTCDQVGDRFVAGATNDIDLVTASVSEAVPDSIIVGDCFVAAAPRNDMPGVISF